MKGFGVFSTLLLQIGFAQPSQSSRTISVFPRSVWRAKPAKNNCRRHSIHKITVHHTASVGKNSRTTAKRLRSYQAYHQNKKGWIDLAYHYLIDSVGDVYQGRSVECAGDTSTNYNPSGHFLIVLDGNFEKQLPSQKAQQRLIELITYARQAYDVAPENVLGHRDVAATACPGKQLYQRLGHIKKQVFAELNKGPIKLRLVVAEKEKSVVPKSGN